MTQGPSEAARGRSSIAARLILWLTLGTTLLWCIGAGWATLSSYRELGETLDQSMQQMAERLLALGRDDLLGHEDDDARVISEFGSRGRMQLIYRLTDATGRPLLSEGEGRRIPWPPYLAAGFTSIGDWRFFRAEDPKNNLGITMAASLHERHQALKSSVEAMLWPLAALIPIQVLVILFGVRGGLRPLEALRSEIARRGAENLAPLDPSAQPRELRPIAEALARLMERLRTALDAERAFAANAAHELRTPIAGALAQTQRLLAEVETAAARHRAEGIEGTLKRLSRLSEKLIQISRVDAGLGLADAVTDLKPVLDIVLRDAVAHWDAEDRLRYDPEGAPPLMAAMDPDAFAITLRNLLDNALRHAPPGSEVSVTRPAPNTVRVVNAGPVVPPAALAALTGRFVRLHGGGEGSGLGLSIVQAIMEQSGGALDLRSPAEGRQDGFQATLRLPSG